MSERLLAAVDALESVICERYNVRSLAGVGPFPEAFAQARVGNVGPLRDALRGREMYRWRETVAVMFEAISEIVAPKPIEETPVKLMESGTRPRRRSRTNG